MEMLTTAAAVLAVVCLIGWLIEVRTCNAGHVDVIWTWGLALCAGAYLALGEGGLVPRVLAGLLVLVWGLRLGGHVLKRVLSEPEDGRYRAMRERLGTRVHAFHLVFFLIQGLLAWLFALPHWVIASHPQTDLSVWMVLGFVIGVVALAGESIADRQLDQWRRNPANRGKTCRSGLWRYSRHPNYFFEWLHWFAYPLIAMGAPGAAWLWIAPVAMLVFLWFITGIPYTEKQALKSRGDDYRRYQQTTSPFIPWRPST